MQRIKKPKTSTHWARPLAVTIALMLLVAASSFFVTKWVSKTEEDQCFVRLYQETHSLANEIESRAKSDREQLEMIAAVVAQCDDLQSPWLWKLLDSYQTVGMMSRLELLLPDDTVLTTGGQSIDASGVLSFAKESALGAHITDRERDLDEEGSYIVRHYVPVVRDGQTIALLFGVVELGVLPQEVLGQPYGGEAAIYIIDGSTGDMLVDTWHHSESGNFWALGERPMAPGYDHQQLSQGLTNGETGYVVFVSQSIGRYLYFYFCPVQINQWRVALSVPEDVVFSSANAIRGILNFFLLFEALCFVLYFLWMLHYVRRETNEKQRQLEALNYLYDVENLLFTAHERQENVMTALEKLSHITMAQRLGFWLLEPMGDRQVYLWDRDEETDPAPQQWRTVERLISYFQQGHSIFRASTPEQLQPMTAGEIPAKNLVAVPIQDTDGKICGVLTARNLPERQLDATLLKSVSFSFSMFCHNRRTYNAIRLLGERDSLSGLYNRNRYEMDLPDYQKRHHTSLACVYLDANGLHELNNNFGHEAGDRMLRTVGQTMQESFGSQHTYRIGGDEFVAFVLDREKAAVEQMAQEMRESLQRQGIYVSIGVEWQQEVRSMQELVREAEQKMYAEKTAYYRATGRGAVRGN